MNGAPRVACTERRRSWICVVICVSSLSHAFDVGGRHRSYIRVVSYPIHPHRCNVCLDVFFLHICVYIKGRIEHAILALRVLEVYVKIIGAAEPHEVQSRRMDR